MDNQANLILVTWDFTNISQCALEHAIKISRTVKQDIGLLHIVSPDTSEKEIESRKDRMAIVAEETERRFGIKPDIRIITGSIFRSISKYVSEQNVSMVVMGTHGMTRLQRIFGSWALKVIVGSSIPFIVVQDKPKSLEKYSNIVFPIDFKSENKEKLIWAIYFGKYFNSKVHLYKYPVMDKSLQKKVNTNLNFAIRFLIQNNLDYEIHSPDHTKDYMKDTVTFAKRINADLIMIMTTKYITYIDYIFGAKEQMVIANDAKIPVMCVNPKVSSTNIGQVMY